MNYFVSRGWTREQAAGIAASIEVESNWRPHVTGDSGQAYGLGQWHPDRQANFRRRFGHDIRNSTFEEQLAFFDWELRNTEHKAGEKLHQARTAGEAGGVVSQYFERPRDIEGNRRARARRAEQILAGTPAGEPPPTAAQPGAGAGGPAPGGTAQQRVGATVSAVKGAIHAVIGDSIAEGISMATGLPRDAISGTTPQQIYERVQRHVGDFAGKNVILASGSNPNAGFDPKQMNYVRETMKALHKVGAHVVLMGVGSGVRDYMRINRELSGIAHEFGDPFGGELAGTSGGRVHPRDYNAAYQQARKVMIDSNHKVEINVYGDGNPHGTAAAVAEVQSRHSMLHARNLETPIA
jgi:hypothetical protein